MNRILRMCFIFFVFYSTLSVLDCSIVLAETISNSSAVKVSSTMAASAANSVDPKIEQAKTLFPEPTNDIFTPEGLTPANEAVESVNYEGMAPPVDSKDYGIEPADVTEGESVIKADTINTEQNIQQNDVVTEVVTKEQDVKEDFFRKYVNQHKISFFATISGGIKMPLSFVSSTTTMMVGVAPQFGGTVGFSWFPVPHFGLSLGVRAEHIFDSTLTSLHFDKNAEIVKPDNTITLENFLKTGKFRYERTSVLADIYLDFRQGLWSSFFINIVGGYSWLTTSNGKEQAPTVGFGLGVRWFAHKYVSLDWTLLESRLTLAKTLMTELGTNFGITVRY